MSTNLLSMSCKIQTSWKQVLACLRLTHFLQVVAQTDSPGLTWVRTRSIFRCGECKLCFSEHILSVMFKVQSRCAIIKTKVRERANVLWETGDTRGLRWWLYWMCLLPQQLPVWPWPLPLPQLCTWASCCYNLATSLLWVQKIGQLESWSLVEVVGFPWTLKEG